MQIIFTNWKKLALLLLVAFKAINSFGQVTIETTPNSVSVSADDVGTFVPITLKIIGSSVNDFGTSAGKYYIRLDAPTGWEFNDTKALTCLKRGYGITYVDITLFNPNYLVIEYDFDPDQSDPTSSPDRLMIANNLEIRPTTRIVEPAAYITRGDATSLGYGYTDATVNGLPIGSQLLQLPLIKTPGEFKQLQALLPGETRDPGSATGKKGTANPQTAGETITVSVNAVDAVFNIVTTVAGEVSLTANVNGVMPAKANLVDGAKTFDVILTQAGPDAKISASGVIIYNTNNTANTSTANTATTSSPITINPASYSKLQILAPGETLYPSSATGKTGTPNSFKAGKAEQITVRAVDKYWNLVSSANTIKISATGATSYVLDPNTTTVAMPVSGIYNFDVTFNVAGQKPTIIVTDEATPSINAEVSLSVSVGDYAKLLVLLPGETLAPNTLTGKTGVVNKVVAGTQISGEVYAVDEYWNVVTSVNNQINITGSKNATISSPITLTAGQAAFSAMPAEAATHTFTATDPAKNFIANSSGMVVTTGAYKKLLIVLPGETATPGSASGKTGTATDRVSGQGFEIEVFAVDEYWNKVSSVTNTIKITSNDLIASFPSGALTAGSKKFRITLKTVSKTATITAIDDTDGSITSYTTGNINVKSGEFRRLLFVFPGEQYDKSEYDTKLTVKSGTRTTIKAGEPTIIKIYILDKEGNIITTATDDIKLSDKIDANAVINPPIASAASGIATFTVTFKKASRDHQLIANDLTSGVPTDASSDLFEVLAGTYTKILALLPGQTYNPGSATGVWGAISVPPRGQAMNIKLIAVDNYFNAVSSVNNVINRTQLSDPNAKNLPETATFANGELTFSNVIIETAGAQSVIYQDQAQGIDITINIPDPSIESKSTDYFRSAASGEWGTASNWESSADGVIWGKATLSPTDAAAKITINGHVIQIKADVTVNRVTIENGGTVEVNQGALTIASGGSIPNFTVNGILKNATDIVTNGILEIGSAGKYQHAFTTDAGVIPTATWKEGSICEVMGYTSFAGNINGANQTFSNFDWNAPNQTANVSINTDFKVKNFTITSTGRGRLIFNNTTTNISGNFTLRKGDIDFTNTNLNFDGTTDQSIFNYENGPLEFKNVAFSNRGVKTFAQGGVDLISGGFLKLERRVGISLNANGKLTIQPDAAIDQIPPGSNITGNVTVNILIRGGAKNPYRTWRMISSPTNNGNTYSLADVIDDVIITGEGGENKGFDKTSGNSPTAFIYTSDKGFVAISSKDEKIPKGKGFFLFFRGNRSNFKGKTTYPFVDPENTIIDFTGVLNQGDIAVPLTYSASPATGSFNLVGNPYASAINFGELKAVNSDLANEYVRIWNPANRSYKTDIASNNPSIAAGQSFFVQSNSGGTLIFQESFKVNVQPPPALLFNPENSLSDLPLKQASGNDNKKILNGIKNENYSTGRPLIKIQLKKPSSYNMDETCIAFNPSGNSKYLIAEDACYMPAEEIKLASLSSDNVNLAYNIMEEIGEGKTVKLVVEAMKSDKYSLTFNLSDISSGVKIWLIDKYLNTQTPVSDGQTVNFAIDKSISASFGNERFSLVFNQEPTLESVITDFKGKKVNEGVMLSWVAKAVSNGDYFQIQRAGSDKIYSPLTTTVKAKNELSSYVLLDSKPLAGNNHYQLSMVDKDGKKITYSQVVSVYYNGISKASFTVYPNPASEKITLKYEEASGDQNMIRIANITGQFIYDKNVNESELQNGFEINLSTWAPGVYLVELIDKMSGKRIDVQKLIKR